MSFRALIVVVALGFTLAVSLLSAPLHATGPGLGNVAWSADQVFAPVGFIESPQGHGNVTMVNGYLMVITSSDGGGNATDGAIEFWDVSSLTAPVRVARVDTADTHALREAHGFSLARVDDATVLAAQGEEGIVFFDVTNAPEIALLANLDLPGIAEGDYTGDWWLFWQAPYVFVAGTDNGLTVVDASNPSAPAIVKHLSTGELAGVSPAQAFALGNLLVLMESQSRALLTMDISRPDAPRVLRRLDGKPGYSHIFASSGKIFTSGNIPPQMHIHQVSHEGGIEFVSTNGFYFNSGGYGSYQDGVFHTGFSDRYVKFDAVTGDELGTGSSGRDGRDEDFAVVLGNVVFAGDDHGEGTALIAHQAAQDTSAPVVEWMHPASGATDIALTSRVGLSFSDHVDIASLSVDTVYLEDDAGGRVPSHLSSSMGLVNISPIAPLEPLRTYRVVASGVRDLAGNASAPFEATIVTGDGNDVVVDPLTIVPAVSSNSPFGEYAVGTFSTGAATYIDRDFTFSAGYPERLEGQPYIQTRNNDKLGFSADFLTFTLAAPAEVLVLFDVRADAPPDWLDAFAPTGETVSNNDTSYDIYTKDFVAGDITLGGNSASGSAGTASMYSVVVVTEQLDCALALAPAPAGSVTLSAGSPNASARYDWQVGAQVLDDAGSSPQVTLAAGRHSVVVTVSIGAQVATCSAVQIVHRPLLSVAERARTSTSVLWRNGHAIVVNTDNGTVTSVNVTDGGSVAWETATGTAPVALAVTPSGDLWVLDRKDATIAVLDADSGALSSTIALPRASRPEALVIGADGTAFVTLGARGEVARIDDSGNIETMAFVVDTARGLTLFGDTLYVSRFLSPDTHAEIVVVDADTLAVRDTIELAYDVGPDTEGTGAGVLNQLSALRISADGTRGFVGASKANIGRGVFRDGRALTFESRVRSTVATIDLGTNIEILNERRDINDRDSVQANAPSPLGDLLLVASQGGNSLDVFENDVPDTANGRRVSQIAVGRGPQGVAIDDATGMVAVQNALARSVTLFDARALFAGTGNALLPLGTVTTVADEVLDATVLRGKQLFYDASDRRICKDGYISCASCHLDGGHDGRTWDFTQAGEGVRNTVTLVGRVGTERMGRVHWTANFDEIQDFENDIRNAFGGTGLLSDEDFALTSDPLGAPKAGRSDDLDALAAFVTSLRAVPASPHREDSGRLTDDARRGRALFNDNACATCHVGAQFTDLLKHDVGTQTDASGLGIGASLDGVGFDTPTLKGVFDTAPYLHDGSAATLDDVLARHGGLDGTVAVALDDIARADLRAYLTQLDEASGAPEADCALTDECVRLPPAGGEGEGEGEGEAPPAVGVTPVAPRGCGCASTTPLDAMFVTLGALLLLIKRRRR